jgi:hypothetical protein
MAYGQPHNVLGWVRDLHDDAIMAEQNGDKGQASKLNTTADTAAGDR